MSLQGPCYRDARRTECLRPAGEDHPDVLSRHTWLHQIGDRSTASIRQNRTLQSDVDIRRVRGRRNRPPPPKHSGDDDDDDDDDDDCMSMSNVNVKSEFI